MGIEETAHGMWLDNPRPKIATDLISPSDASRDSHDTPHTASPAMVRIAVSKAAAIHFVEDMRSYGFEAIREGIHVTFARDGKVDPRFFALIDETGSHVGLHLDLRPLTVGTETS